MDTIKSSNSLAFIRLSDQGSDILLFTSGALSTIMILQLLKNNKNKILSAIIILLRKYFRYVSLMFI